LYYCRAAAFKKPAFAGFLLRGAPIPLLLDLLAVRLLLP